MSEDMSLTDYCGVLTKGVTETETEAEDTVADMATGADSEVRRTIPGPSR
jgi:hypothetical protein